MINGSQGQKKRETKISAPLTMINGSSLKFGNWSVKDSTDFLEETSLLLFHTTKQLRGLEEVEWMSIIMEYTRMYCTEILPACAL